LLKSFQKIVLKDTKNNLRDMALSGVKTFENTRSRNNKKNDHFHYFLNIAGGIIFAS